MYAYTTKKLGAPEMCDNVRQREGDKIGPNSVIYFMDGHKST